MVGNAALLDELVEAFSTGTRRRTRPSSSTESLPGCRVGGMSEAIRRRAVVHGRVQGVFFRDSCRQLAQAAGVAGSVRNEPDGTVAAVFEGDPDAVRRMVDWCRTGPPSAHGSPESRWRRATDG